MEKVLYADFLKDEKIYNLAQAAWRRIFEDLLKKKGYSFEIYLNDRVNGKKEYDGNPIFNAYIPKLKRAVRIIQVSPEEEGDNISAWIDDIELQNKKTQELVLDIKMTRDAKLTAREILGAWIEGKDALKKQNMKIIP